MRGVFLLAIFSATLGAQTSKQADLTRLTGDLRTALDHDEFARAAELAGNLDDGIRAARNAWLVRDARARTDEILSYLPADTEGFWVNQEPLTIKAGESSTFLAMQPAVLYSIDRLKALNADPVPEDKLPEGKFYRALSNHTIRMVMGATRGIRRSSEGFTMPATFAEQDVVYFYFFAEPVDLGTPDESIANHSAWRGVAQINTTKPGPPFPPPRTSREDENWIAQARADVLVLSNRKDLLAEVLGRMDHGSSARALPASLPEWSEVDRDASFWGLRHYTEASRPPQGDWRYAAAFLPEPDGAAVGATVRFYAKSQSLEIRYLSPAQLAKGSVAESMRSSFQIDQPRTGVWRLVSNVGERGASPMHTAFCMLGFGGYR
jgi:hypothetical protein